MNTFRPFLVLALLGAGPALGPQSPAPSPKSPDVLLITLDTTRADRMGFLGSTRGLTPALDAFAKTATVFTRAYAQAPITTVSHATILTGTFPPFHRVTDFGLPLSGSVPYLPQLFHDHGYRTAAFVGSLILDPRDGTAPGFDRGFDVYDAGFRLRRPGEDRYDTIERRGSDVAGRALRWLDGARSSGGARGGSRASPPWFLWVHLFDPHDPYDPPADLKRRFAASPYDGEIAEVDRLAGQLIQAAGSDAIVAVAADHGEALGDHGEESHGMFLYDAELHVPLVVRAPSMRGARIASRVRLADLAPTLLESAGIPVPRTMQGESLGRLRAEATADRPAYAETEYPRRAFGWSPLTAWRADRFLYIRAPKPELYDLVADPAAAHNLADVRGRVVDGMQKELDEFVRRTLAPGSTPVTSGAPAVDPDLARRLASLGYVSGSSGPPSTGIDPKDRIALANALHDAAMAVDDGAFQKAIPLLEKVTASEPDVKLAQLQLGVSRAHQKQFARAVAPLKKAIALDPEDMFAHYELGVALYETGDLKTAAGHFEIVTTRMPKWADARYSYASVLARIDRVSDAVRELGAAIELDPRHFRANLLLGRILTLQGHADEAVPYLRTAVAVQPANAEANQFLKEALAKAGSDDERDEGSVKGEQ